MARSRYSSCGITCRLRFALAAVRAIEVEVAAARIDPETHRKSGWINGLKTKKEEIACVQGRVETSRWDEWSGMESGSGLCIVYFEMYV